MKYGLKKACAFILAVVLICSYATVNSVEVNAAEDVKIYSDEAELYSGVSYENVLKEAAEAMTETVTEPTYAQTGGEWAVIGAARSGYEDSEWYSLYYENIENVITTNESAKLSTTKSTENSRVILALTAIGADVTNVGGYNLLEPLSDFDYVKKQGINGAIYALLAFDSGDYDIPTLAPKSSGTQTTRDGIIEYLSEKELSGGGFDLSNLSANADVTAMVLQALAPYYENNEEAAAIIDRGLDVLSEMQNDDGTFSSYGSANAESTAQVVTALSLLKIDCDTDNRFVKSNGSALDGLLSFYDTDSKSFMHTTTDDQMATEQSIYALTAYDRYKNNENSLYDMSDVTEALYLTNAKLSSVKNTKSGIKLTWKKVTGANAYIIYRKSSEEVSWKKYKTISNGSKHSFTDKKVTNGVIYTYKICATSGKKDGSLSSAKKIYRLKKETADVTKIKSNSIKITWSKNSKADGYLIKYSTESSMSDAKTLNIKNAGTRTKTISGLQKGKKYYVTVCSYKIVNGKKYYSAWSKKVKLGL